VEFLEGKAEDHWGFPRKWWRDQGASEKDGQGDERGWREKCPSL